MPVRLMLAVAVAVFTISARTARVDAPVYQWKTERDRVCLSADGRFSPSDRRTEKP